MSRETYYRIPSWGVVSRVDRGEELGVGERDESPARGTTLTLSAAGAWGTRRDRVGDDDVQAGEVSVEDDGSGGEAWEDVAAVGGDVTRAESYVFLHVPPEEDLTLELSQCKYCGVWYYGVVCECRMIEEGRQIQHILVGETFPEHDKNPFEEKEQVK